MERHRFEVMTLNIWGPWRHRSHDRWTPIWTFISHRCWGMGSQWFCDYNLEFWII